MLMPQAGTATAARRASPVPLLLQLLLTRRLQLPLSTHGPSDTLRSVDVTAGADAAGRRSHKRSPRHYCGEPLLLPLQPLLARGLQLPLSAHGPSGTLRADAASRHSYSRSPRLSTAPAPPAAPGAWAAAALGCPRPIRHTAVSLG